MVKLYCIVAVCLLWTAIQVETTQESVRFSLCGQTYKDGDTVLIDEIGEGENALLCMTNRQDCCFSSMAGHFYYPNGTAVAYSRTNSLHRDRGPQVVRLNRRHNIFQPLGRYRCDIPDSSGEVKSIYINITKALQCPSHNLTNGRVLISSTGDLASYSCVSDYTLVGPVSRHCQFNGNWSGSEPLCQHNVIPASEVETLKQQLDEVKQLILDQKDYFSSKIYSLQGELKQLNQSNQELQFELLYSNERVQLLQQELNESYSRGMIQGIYQDFNAFRNNMQYELVLLNQTVNLKLLESKSEVQSLQQKLNAQTNTSLQSNFNSSAPCTEKALTCEKLHPPIHGEVSVAAGPNSLSYGLGSVTTYSCESGYALVGRATRVCEDINGGTITTGEWSGSQPSCQALLCPEMPALDNGRVTLSNKIPQLGTVANFSCDVGFVLAGVPTRTCHMAHGRNTGVWVGATPRCERIAKCQLLHQPSNGKVNISPGVQGVELSVGSVATYSCNSGYRLVGGATRRCVTASGRARGSWSGSTPTCQRIISCPSLPNPSNGSVTLAPNDSSGIIRVGSVATYSCNEGYLLRGLATRECRTTYNRYWQNVGTWSGEQPSCEEVVYCPPLLSPDNGRVSVSSGGNYLSVGSLATYSCDSDYALVGGATRTCEDPDRDSVGTWTGIVAKCQLILCPALPPVDNGIIVISSTSTSPLLTVGTIASYSCDPSFILMGQTTRTCREGSNGALGTWDGVNTTCALPDRSLVDCRNTRCQNEHIVCPEEEDCEIHCSHTRPHACYKTSMFCPQGSDCTISCDDSHSCLQATTVCPQAGNCTLNCQNDYTCLKSDIRCSGDVCLSNCIGTGSCSNSTIECSSGNSNECIFNCDGSSSCSNMNFSCHGAQCVLNCDNSDSCLRNTLELSGTNNYLKCEGAHSCANQTVSCFGGSFTLDCQDYIAYDDKSNCQRSKVTCPPNESCNISCVASHHNDVAICQQSYFMCSNSSQCTISCVGRRACSDSNFVSGYQGAAFTNCSGQYACQDSQFVCSKGENCTVNCEYGHSCRRSSFVCGEGSNCLFGFSGLHHHRSGYSAAITCEDGSNCHIQCITTDASLTQASYNTYSCYSSRINCPVEGNGSCNVECISRYSCQSLTITCGPNKDCLTCSGQYSCDRATITYHSTSIANLNCSGTYSCRSSAISCPANETCLTSCSGSRSCQSARIMCPLNNACFIPCSGPSSCRALTVSCGHSKECVSCSGSKSCQRVAITFPSNQIASLNCSGSSSCQQARVTCPGNDCTINCPSDKTCQHAVFTCPKNSSCTINCDGVYSCKDAQVICPPGDYSCNILCTNPLSCGNLQITNTQNVNLQCCGDLACIGAAVGPTSYQCPFIQ